MSVCTSVHSHRVYSKKQQRRELQWQIDIINSLIQITWTPASIHCSVPVAVFFFTNGSDQNFSFESIHLKGRYIVRQWIIWFSISSYTCDYHIGKYLYVKWTILPFQHSISYTHIFVNHSATFTHHYLFLLVLIR